jgi:hypothetical protein
MASSDSEGRDSPLWVVKARFARVADAAVRAGTSSLRDNRRRPPVFSLIYSECGRTRPVGNTSTGKGVDAGGMCLSPSPNRHDKKTNGSGDTGGLPDARRDCGVSLPPGPPPLGTPRALSERRADFPRRLCSIRSGGPAYRGEYLRFGPCPSSLYVAFRQHLFRFLHGLSTVSFHQRDLCRGSVPIRQCGFAAR